MEQTTEAASKGKPEWEKEVAPEFRINTGQSGQIFNEDSKTGHRFFALAEENPEWKKRFELSKLEARFFDKVKTPKGNFIPVNPYADQSNLEADIRTAAVIRDNGFKIGIRPLVNGKIILNHKNPEYFIGEDPNEYRGDRKSPKGKRIKTLVKNSIDQGCSFIVFDLENYPYSIERFERTLRDTFYLKENYPEIKEVFIRGKNNEFLHFTRDDFFDDPRNQRKKTDN